MMKKNAQHERTSERTGSTIAGAVTSSVGPDNVDADVLAMSSLDHADYADHFVLAHETDPRQTPEQWARTMFGDTPDLIERLLWSGILRLRLQAGRSTGTIAGWRITDRGEDWISVTAASRSMSAVLVIRACASTVELATIVRYDRSRARLVWVPTAFVHRRLAPGLLRSTARSMA